MDNQLIATLNNILEKKSDEFQNNDIFSILSLLTLNRIVDTFSGTQLTQTGPQSTASSNNNLSNLFSQIQGADNDNLQRILPLLMNVLGNKNNLSNLMNSANNTNSGQNRQQNNNQAENDSEEDNEDKKKAI